MNTNLPLVLVLTSLGLGTTFFYYSKTTNAIDTSPANRLYHPLCHGCNLLFLYAVANNGIICTCSTSKWVVVLQTKVRDQPQVRYYLLNHISEIIYPRYLPSGARTEEGVPKPNQFGISDYDDLRISTPDGETLAAYFVRATDRRKTTKTTMLMFHGNAGNIGHRLPIARMLERHTDCDVLMLEYRGYGLSTGTPDENGLNIDAQAGLDWIRKNEETKKSNIVIYGQSLGGAVAISLVTKNIGTGDIAGLILENTFLSIRKMIPNVFPPAKYLAPLCHQRWASEEMIPLIKDIPVLFISGLKDEIVPPSHMKELFSLCRVNTKIWKEFSTGSHNETVAEAGYFACIADFVNHRILHPK